MEVTVERLDEVIRCIGYHQKIPQYGNRAWIARALHLDVIYWDQGNSWCGIMQVIPKKGYEDDVRKFFRQVQKHPGE